MKIVYLGETSKKAIEERVRRVAAAGALSRSEGTVTEVYNSRNNYENNLKLIKNVLNYGHTSIAEHDYLVFALENVTPIIEQIIIGYRLTSFTIKSRREVDFRSVGGYIPVFKDSNGKILKNNEELQMQFKEYTDYLFNCYGYLVDNGIPVEDARYILPYCFHSNIIMGCDAHELANMTSDLLYGEYSHITEAYELGSKLKDLIIEYAPYLKDYIDKEKSNDYYIDSLALLDDKLEQGTLRNCLDDKIIPSVECLDSSKDIDRKVILYTLMSRYGINKKNAEKIWYKIRTSREDFMDDSFVKNVINAIYHNKHQRELEQVTYTFQIPISLANLTHLTRHRMHSLIVPDFIRFNLDNYIIPPSIESKFGQEYHELYTRNKEVYAQFLKNGVRKEDLIYLLLSGNTCNVITTMNARTLSWISRMRCCNKAQWEIRKIAKEMVELARKESPIVATGFGPNCQVFNFCKEGKDSCKNKQHVMTPKK